MTAVVRVAVLTTTGAALATAAWVLAWTVTQIRRNARS